MKIFSNSFTIIGLLLLCISVGTFIYSKNFVEKSDIVTGTISELDVYTTINSDGDKVTKYTVLVDYSYNGIDYKDQSLSEYSSSMKEGSSIELLVNPENPCEIRTNIMIYFIPIIFGSLGIIFGTIGVCFLVSETKADLKDKKTKENGRKIVAEIKNIENDYSFQVNGEPAKILVCKHIDIYSGIEHTYRSRRIIKLNENLIGKEVDVYINDKTGYVFVDFKSIL